MSMNNRTKAILTAAFLTVVFAGGILYQADYNRRIRGMELRLPVLSGPKNAAWSPVNVSPVKEKPFWNHCQWDHDAFTGINSGLNRIPFLEFVLGWTTNLAEPYMFFPAVFVLVLISSAVSPRIRGL